MSLPELRQTFVCPRLLPALLVVLSLTGCATGQGGSAPEGVSAKSFASDRELRLDDPMPVDDAVFLGTLDNGLRYYVRRNTRPEDLAEIRLVVAAGSVHEDDDQLGLAHFVEHMAFNGTRNFEKQALVDYLESIGTSFGAHLNAYTSFDETVYQLQVPTDDAAVLDKAFVVLSDWASGVTFDEEEVEKERGVVLEEWRQRLGAGSRVRDQQFPVLFHKARYAERMPIGDPEDPQNL